MTVFSRLPCAFQVQVRAADRLTSPVTGSLIAVTSDPAKQTICIEGPPAPPQLPKGPSFLAGMLDEREVAQRPLQSDDLTRDKLCNRQADDRGSGTHVCDESSHFVARQAVRLRTKTEDDLIAIYDVDIEMDGNTRATRHLEPIEKRLTGEVKIVRTKRSDPPTGGVGEIVFGPGMQTDKSHSTGIKGGRQKAKHVRISMTGEDGNRHRMVSGVVTSGSADVGVRVDPQHRQIIPIAAGQPGEWRHAHGVLSAKREDSLRAVADYHLQLCGQLRDSRVLGF